MWNYTFCRNVNMVHCDLQKLGCLFRGTWTIKKQRALAGIRNGDLYSPYIMCFNQHVTTTALVSILYLLISMPHRVTVVARGVVFFRLSIRPSVPFSWTTWGNFFKSGTNIPLVLRMIWLDFGAQCHCDLIWHIFAVTQEFIGLLL